MHILHTHSIRHHTAHRYHTYHTHTHTIHITHHTHILHTHPLTHHIDITHTVHTSHTTHTTRHTHTHTHYYKHARPCLHSNLSVHTLRIEVPISFPDAVIFIECSSPDRGTIWSLPLSKSLGFRQFPDPGQSRWTALRRALTLTPTPSCQGPFRPAVPLLPGRDAPCPRSSPLHLWPVW